jgi:hypothetical protein
MTPEHCHPARGNHADDAHEHHAKQQRPLREPVKEGPECQSECVVRPGEIGHEAIQRTESTPRSTSPFDTSEPQSRSSSPENETSSLSDTKSYGTFDSDSKSYGILDSHCDSDSHVQYCMCYPLSSVLQAEEGIDEQDDRMSTRSRMRVRQILAICVGHFVSMTMLCGLLLFVLIFRTMNKGDGGMA